MLEFIIGLIFLLIIFVVLMIRKTNKELTKEFSNLKKEHERIKKKIKRTENEWE